MTPEVAQRIEDLVGAAPKVPPKKICWCALSRVAWQVDEQARLGFSFEGKLNLTGYALELGLKFAEPEGLMHGWDEAEKPGSGTFTHARHLDGFAEGEELGRYLFKKYGGGQ